MKKAILKAAVSSALMSAVFCGLACLALDAHADSITDIPHASPSLMCTLKGSEAVFVAKMRAKGMTEQEQNAGIAAKPVNTQDDQDFEVRMTRTIYTVYHDDRYQRNVAPDLIGAMIADDCFDRLAVASGGGE